MKVPALKTDTHTLPVLWQKPNLPIYGWLTCKLLALFITDGVVQLGLSVVSQAFLFTWAYLEITQGINKFRKVLGIIVMILIIVSIFKQ